MHLSLLILIMILIKIFASIHEYHLQRKIIMLETSEERVKLLKAGISTRTIEQLYLQSNCYKIIGIPVLFNMVEIILETKVQKIYCEASAAYVDA